MTRRGATNGHDHADDGGASDIWDDLVEGRRTVTAHFDWNGRRTLVLHRTVDGAGLTERERRVFAKARSGHAGKRIAYELGLSEAMVSVTLRSVAAKLGARSRLELVRLFAHVDGGDR